MVAGMGGSVGSVRSVVSSGIIPLLVGAGKTLATLSLGAFLRPFSWLNDTASYFTVDASGEDLDRKGEGTSKMFGQ